MLLEELSKIAAQNGNCRLVISYNGDDKYALGISDGVTTPLVINGTLAELQTAIVEKLPGYLELAAKEASKKTKPPRGNCPFSEKQMEDSIMPENNAKNTDARPRKFVFNGMQLADPDPKMTPQKVAEFHSLLHAELTNVTIKGPTKTADGFDEYTDESRENQPRKSGTSVPAFQAGTDDGTTSQSR